MSQPKVRPRFLICVSNEGYAASLELRKVYQSLPDALAAGRHFVRVIDESGADYLYPEQLFVQIELPRTAELAFDRAS